jgi:hypothetical protein
MAIERREYLDDVGGTSSAISVQYDISTGVIYSRGIGEWSPSQTSAYFSDWRQIVERIHKQGGFAPVLADMSESVVQKTEIAKIVTDATEGLYRDADAIAMLVPSNLAKLQMRRVLDGKFHGFSYPGQPQRHGLAAVRH